MKRKSIVIFLLMALLLNITHDFIVLEKSSEHCKRAIQLTVENLYDGCCSKSMELHKVFHFVAILSQLKLLCLSPSLVEFSHDHAHLPLVYYQHFTPPKS